MLRKIIPGLFAAFCFPVVFAQTCPAGQEPYWSHALSSGTQFSSGSSACSDYAAKTQAYQQTNIFGSGTNISRSGAFTPPTTCTITGSNTNVATGDTTQVSPSTYYLQTGCRPASPPPPAPTCPSQNSRFYDGLETTFQVPPGSTLSDLDTCAPSAPSQTSGSGCTVEYDGVIATGADGKSYFSGTSKASSAACNYSPTPTPTETPKADYPPPPPETAKPPPPGTCPGEVNGELVFVPCSFGPSTETVSVTKTRANGTDTITDNFTGSSTCNATTCTWTVTSNSSSSSGGSSSKTQNGTATNTGGNGDGTGDGEQGEPCGGPGQAICRVDVDETGTKSAGDYSKGDTALKTASDAAVKALGDSTKQTDLGGREWSFTFPSGSCTPIALGFSIWHFTVDLCSFPNIDLFRAFWAWAFGVMGALYIWRTVSSSIG